MNINELIQLLEAFRQAHGDLPVLVDDGGVNPAVIENTILGSTQGAKAVFLELI